MGKLESWKWLIVERNGVKFGTRGYQWNIYGITLTSQYSTLFWGNLAQVRFFLKYDFHIAASSKLIILFQPNFL